MYRNLTALAVLILLTATCAPDQGPVADLLFQGGSVLDGSGSEVIVADLAVTGDRIVFLGDAQASEVQARDTLDVSGLLVTPGLVDMHSHAELDADYGRDGRAFLHQGITTVALGVDGGGGSDVAERLAGWDRAGIGVNALLYVGHNAARRAVMGMEDRAPSMDELDAMKAFVRKGMEEAEKDLDSLKTASSREWFANVAELVCCNRIIFTIVALKLAWGEA